MEAAGVEPACSVYRLRHSIAASVPLCQGAFAARCGGPDRDTLSRGELPPSSYSPSTRRHWEAPSPGPFLFLAGKAVQVAYYAARKTGSSSIGAEAMKLFGTMRTPSAV